MNAVKGQVLRPVMPPRGMTGLRMRRYIWHCCRQWRPTTFSEGLTWAADWLHVGRARSWRGYGCPPTMAGRGSAGGDEGVWGGSVTWRAHPEAQATAGGLTMVAVPAGLRRGAPLFVGTEIGTAWRLIV